MPDNHREGAYYLRLNLFGEHPIRSLDDLRVLRLSGVLLPDETVATEPPDAYVEIPCVDVPANGFGFYVLGGYESVMHVTFAPGFVAFEDGGYQDDVSIGRACQAARRLVSVFPTINENLTFIWRAVNPNPDPAGLFAKLVGQAGTRPETRHGLGLAGGRLHLFYRGAAAQPWPELVIQPVAGSMEPGPDDRKGIIVSVAWDPISGDEQILNRPLDLAEYLDRLDEYVDDATDFLYAAIADLDAMWSEP